MTNQETRTVHLRIVYDGTPPNVWDGGAKDFGLQDKENVLHAGKTERGGHVVFDVAIGIRTERKATPVFVGDFAHGTPKERFLYLSWRNANGAYAQRLKLPLGGISWNDIDAAQEGPIVGKVAAAKKPRVPGGTNIGGTRAVAWRPLR